jgi:hypothetical protein
MPKGFRADIWLDQIKRRGLVCLAERKWAFVSSATTFDDLKMKPTAKSLPFGVLAMLLNVGNNKKTA